MLVYLHGGGWMLGSLDSADAVCRFLSCEADCIVASIGYRLAPEHRFPVAIEESYAMTAWLASHADELGGDAARVAIAGDSAGGTMAAAICVMARDRGGPRLVFQLLINPATDVDADRPSMSENAFPPLSSRDDVMWFLERYLRGAEDLLDPRALPARAASHSGLPGAFVLTAEFDILRDGAEAYADRLRAAGVPASYKRYPGMTHGFFDHTTVLEQSREAMTDAVSALREAFGV
jgi:acetyl esterase